MRTVTTRVLPVPAPASTSTGPSVVVTARRCSGLSEARIFKAAEGSRAGDRGKSRARGSSRTHSGCAAGAKIDRPRWVPYVAMRCVPCDKVARRVKKPLVQFIRGGTHEALYAPVRRGGDRRRRDGGTGGREP